MAAHGVCAEAVSSVLIKGCSTGYFNLLIFGVLSAVTKHTRSSVKWAVSE